MDLSSYHVSYETGFMLRDPLKFLPSYFKEWNDLAYSLPILIKEQHVREMVDKMPLLDHTRLVGHRQLRLAHLQLSLLAAGYVWQDGDKGITQVLPKCLAVPFYRISEILGVQPILSHPSLALANWFLIDENGPFELENLGCLYKLPGERSGEWFLLITFIMELKFAKSLKPLVKIVDLLDSAQTFSKEDSSCSQETENQMANCLDEISNALHSMEVSLARMRDNLDGKTFFNVIRPFLAGWGGENNPLPDGLIYEGISETPIKMTGGSAAQSTTLQICDALLGVEHSEDKRQFLLQMRNFMSPAHKRFIEDLEQKPYKVRDAVSHSSNPTLKSSYNQCLNIVMEFRNYHIQIVKKYVIIPSRQANEGNYGSLDDKGTGGTSLIPFLKDLVSDTEKQLISSASSASASKEAQKGCGWTHRMFITTLAVVAVGLIVVIRK